MEEIERIVRDSPHTVTGIAWNGISYQEKAADTQTGALYALSVLIVFLCLAALYESWILNSGCRDYYGCPSRLSVLWGLTGAFGMHNDIYFKVGLFNNDGLVSKNAILIVEFAKALHEQGEDIPACC